MPPLTQEINLLMKRKILSSFTILFFCWFLGGPLLAQVSVNTNGDDPDPSAILDVESSELGMLLPRMSEAERLSISSPARGLLLFDTEPGNNGFYYNAGNTEAPNWNRLATADQTSVTVCDSRIPVDSVLNASGTIVISEPGSYYFTQNVNYTGQLNGVTISVDNVALDLNGFTLSGDPNNSDDGIIVLTPVVNLNVYNGTIKDWGGEGIEARECNNCSFSNLRLENNDNHGIITDFGAVMTNCVALGNGLDGLEVDDNSLLYNCETAANGGNGITASEVCLVVNCTASDNQADGIDLAAGGRVEGCTANGNGVYGIDLAQSGQVINCLANRNGRVGIDIANSCIARFNQACENGTCFEAGTCLQSELQSGIVGAGIRTFSNSQVMDNVCRGNYYGIRLTSSDAYATDNSVTDNRHLGLFLTTGTFAVRNQAHNNGFDPITNASVAAGNYFFNNGSFGPIVDLSSISGPLTGPTNVNHPLANLIY